MRDDRIGLQVAGTIDRDRRDEGLLSRFVIEAIRIALIVYLTPLLLVLLLALWASILVWGTVLVLESWLRRAARRLGQNYDSGFPAQSNGSAACHEQHPVSTRPLGTRARAASSQSDRSWQ